VWLVMYVCPSEENGLSPHSPPDSETACPSTWTAFPGGDLSQKRGSAHSPLSAGAVCGLPRPLGLPSLFFDKFVKDLSVELHLRVFNILEPCHTAHLVVSAVASK